MADKPLISPRKLLTYQPISGRKCQQPNLRSVPNMCQGQEFNRDLMHKKWSYDLCFSVNFIPIPKLRIPIYSHFRHISCRYCISYFILRARFNYFFSKICVFHRRILWSPQPSVQVGDFQDFAYQAGAPGKWRVDASQLFRYCQLYPARQEGWDQAARANIPISSENTNLNVYKLNLNLTINSYIDLLTFFATQPRRLEQANQRRAFSKFRLNAF